MCILRVLSDTFQDKVSYTQMSLLDKHNISCCIIIQALHESVFKRLCPRYVTGRVGGESKNNYIFLLHKNNPHFSTLNQEFGVFAAPPSETKEVLPNFSETPACSLFTFPFLFNHDLLIVFGANKLWQKVPSVHPIALFTPLSEPHEISQLPS